MVLKAIKVCFFIPLESYWFVAFPITRAIVLYIYVYTD